MKIIEIIGKYVRLLEKVLKKPDKPKIFRKQLLDELYYLGIDSIGIVAVISIFIGAVVVIQTAYNIDTPLIPRFSIGYIARQTIVLEFSPTIISLILAGKIGSRIAGEIGTMRVTEQIDALDVMGINSANYLIFPKVIATLLINPILVVFSMFLGIFGGWLVSVLTTAVSTETYLFGVQSFFLPFEIYYALIKSVVFAFIIATISGFYGYYSEGGALGVGKASTKAVVHSSIVIILFNLILTQILLT